MSRRAKVFVAIGIVLGSVALLVGLGLGGIALFGWLISDPVPKEPEYPVVIGVRAEDDHLQVSTGRPCPTGSRFYIDLTVSSEIAPVQRSLWFTTLEPVSTFDLPDPGPGLRVDRSFPPGGVQIQFDRDRIEIYTVFPNTSHSYTASTEYTDLVDGSNDHPGQYYFGEMGWLTTDEAAARDGVDLLTVCTPRPK